MMDKMNDANHPERFKSYFEWAKFSTHEALSSKEVTGVERITVMLTFLVIEFAAYLDMNTQASMPLEDMLDQLFGKGKDGDK